jgi:hypothetical protein
MSLTKEQATTAVGLIGTTCAAVYLTPLIPPSALLIGTISFGFGSALATTFYRVGDLMKNGKAESNSFGKGLLAGFALFCSLSALYTAPIAMSFAAGASTIAATNTITPSTAIIITGIATLVGLFQNGSSFRDIINATNDTQEIGKSS